MMPWNRKEIWMGQSLEKFTAIRKLLEGHGITYDDSVKSAGWSGGRGTQRETAGMMRAGETLAAEALYYVYVHKYDYDRAHHLLKKL